MKLIACPVCHTQYDVSLVDTSEFACRCGETLENRPLSPVDAAIARCGACGAQVGGDAEGCDYCGSEIVRELDKLSLICPECFARNCDDSRFCVACGVGFSPEPVVATGKELPCPACETRMPPSSVGGIGVNECPGCHGLWVAGDQFDALVKRAARAREERGVTADDPRVKGANPARQKLRYRRCPECDQFMLRVNYRRSSGVILDECNGHGTWLDADELEQVAGFILSGGAANPLLDPEREKLNAQAAAALARARASAHTPMRSRRGLDLELGSGGGLLRMLFDLLT